MQRSTIFVITALLLARPPLDATHAFVRVPYSTWPEAGVASEPLVIVVNRSNPVDDFSFS
jgi:hypothetical protein